MDLLPEWKHKDSCGVRSSVQTLRGNVMCNGDVITLEIIRSVGKEGIIISRER